MSDEQTTVPPSEDSEAPKPARKKRTPEEIQAQREAMLEKRRLREAGGDVAESEAKTKEEPAPAEPAKAEAAPEEKAAASPRKKRTPEEVKAQREAMLEKRRLREAGLAAEPAEKEAPAKPAAPAKKAGATKAAPAKKAAAKKAKPAKAKRAAKKKGSTFQRPQDISRREFLNLAWLGSIALLSIQTLGVSVLFLFPRFKAGEFGGIFSVGTAGDVLPEAGGDPAPFSKGKFWLTNTEEGAYAIYTVCTHLGCLYAWSEVTSRFECPCHGSKFELNGTFIEGPAPRGLDRFKIIATRPDGTKVETPASGGALSLNGDEILEIDTGTRILLENGPVDVSTLT